MDSGDISEAYERVIQIISEVANEIVPIKPKYLLSLINEFTGIKCTQKGMIKLQVANEIVPIKPKYLLSLINEITGIKCTQKGIIKGKDQKERINRIFWNNHFQGLLGSHQN